MMELLFTVLLIIGIAILAPFAVGLVKLLWLVDLYLNYCMWVWEKIGLE